MNIKNYTSNVPVERTVARIEQILASAGACGIVKEHAGGQLESLSFKVELPSGKKVSIRLPANHQSVKRSLLKTVVRPRPGTINRIEEQAFRTSWKLMQDWVEVQVSLIKIQQVDFMQVFLPYVWDGRQTFYDAMKGNDYLALPYAAD